LWSALCDLPIPKSYSSTIGVEFAKKKLTEENTSITGQFWDTSGAERFRAIVTNYYRNSNIILACFSFDDVESFEYIW
jgi:Ras-related protein Rab-1A